MRLYTTYVHTQIEGKLRFTKIGKRVRLHTYVQMYITEKTENNIY